MSGFPMRLDSCGCWWLFVFCGTGSCAREMRSADLESGDPGLSFGMLLSRVVALYRL